MATALIILRQICIMFIYMFIGFLLFKKELITREGSKSLANLLLYSVLPCVIVKSFLVQRTAENTVLLIASLIGSVVLLGMSMLISHILFKKNPIEDFGVAFSNAAFMGFPLVSSVLGADFVFYAAGFGAMLNALQWTYGQSILAKDPSLRSPKAIVKNPLVISLVLGLAVFFTGFSFPEIITSTLGAMSALNAPLAMIILGVYLAQTDLKSMFTDMHLYKISAFRLFVIPALSVLLVKLFMRSYPEVGIALIISASAPIGSNVAVYSQKLGLDYTYAVKLVCLSTIFSIISMPLIIMLL
ncbi:MAG: AEC family transporter [Firmicutes bacterium]|nr:AEC family transporter [Bacillota bacterium]